MFGYETAAWDLGPEITSLDLATPELKPEELESLERRVNAEIAQERAVAPRWIDPESEEVKQIRCRGLPEGVTGPLRVLEIDGIDTNLCCGTHVSNTAHLRQVKFLRVEHARDKGQSRARLHFVAGERVLAVLGGCFDRQLKMNVLLSAAPESHVARVEFLLKADAQAKKDMKSLLAEVVELTAETLRQRAAAGEKVLDAHREKGDNDFMKGLATAVDGSGSLLLTTVGGPGAGMFMLSGPEAAVAELGPKVAEIMKGRGGGKGRYQGKVENVAARREALELLRSSAAAK
eukprot:gnl/TRDRNA2_/TRDRNA2_90037_c1_seq1.p1 gnl/TRDRNA2_/TRDRNA2_90037_c1~~gnl/TRDRNA2_/TRDRNA2_90037_c1_seq1.p1  ORF type:complete len:310 (+),score=78.36 gnl/TRDRNA2_/TRDRNA2_90037_c1_seq1:62-931(+)